MRFALKMKIWACFPAKDPFSDFLTVGDTEKYPKQMKQCAQDYKVGGTWTLSQWLFSSGSQGCWWAAGGMGKGSSWVVLTAIWWNLCRPMIFKYFNRSIHNFKKWNLTQKPNGCSCHALPHPLTLGLLRCLCNHDCGWWGTHYLMRFGILNDDYSGSMKIHWEVEMEHVRLDTKRSL